jgi:hypothetical protein
MAATRSEATATAPQITCFDGIPGRIRGQLPSLTRRFNAAMMASLGESPR